MIVACEPQCKGLSHEKVNEGLLFGLRRAFPNEKLRVYAHESHVKALKDIFLRDKATIENVEYRHIRIVDPCSLHGMVAQYHLLKEIYREVRKDGVNKVFFLSIDPIKIFLIKQLKRRAEFSEIKYTAVLHGAFEQIAFDTFREPPRTSAPKKKSSRINARIIRLSRLVPKGISYAKWRTNQITSLINAKYASFFKKRFLFKAMMNLRHCEDFNYVALSPHIIPNANKYIDIKKLNVFTVEMPFVFVDPSPEPSNSSAKFAVFGFGNSGALYSVANLLSQKNITAPYEIRIIGMDGGGLDEFPHVHCTSHGKLLSREEMEEQARDVDIFLILYESDLYRLSCSASIFEALSYVKPILHLTNDCICHFNKVERPIGICCQNMEEYADRMRDIIENYSSYRHKLKTFRDNILKLREELSSEKTAPKISRSFTF